MAVGNAPHRRHIWQHHIGRIPFSLLTTKRWFLISSPPFSKLAATKYCGAMSGREAICLCQAHQGPIHLALLDVIMPGMNGPELRECLRELAPSVRILFMSGYTYGELVKQGVQAAAGDYLGKPFTHTMLLSRVQETLAEAA